MFEEFLFMFYPRTKKEEQREDDDTLEMAQALALYEKHLEDKN